MTWMGASCVENTVLSDSKSSVQKLITNNSLWKTETVDGQQFHQYQ
jgi:hypothetical protein